MTTQNIDSLMELWNSMFTYYCPPRTQFALWLEMNGAEVTRKGIIALSKKYIRLGCNMTAEHMSRYASSCMKNARLAEKAQVQR